MMRPRSVVLIGMLGLGAGWLAGTTSAPPVQDTLAAQRSEPRPLGSMSAVAGPSTQRLHQKLQPPARPTAGRNPFIFGSRNPPSARRPRSAEFSPPPTPAETTPFPAAPPFQMFTLSGVAATEKDGVTGLTAIVVDNGSLVLAMAGDTLSGGYRVLRVEERAVVVIDAAGVEQIIRLP